VFQTLLLFERLPNSDWLAEHADNNPFRATAEFTAGPYEGMGVIALPDVHHPHLRQLRDLRVGPSRVGHGGAQALALLPPLPPVPIFAHIPPDLENALALVDLAPGETNSYLEELVGLADGLNMAAARVFGDTSANVLLEFVGGSADEVFEAMARVTDHASVQSITVMRTTGDLTTGFGEPAS
jgi:hypothetical protein